MADPLESPTPNDISPFMTSFNTVNESLGLLRHVRRNQSGRATGGDGPELPELPPASRILIQNNTGADLDPFRVLAIGAPLQSIADADHGALNFRRQPSFSGTTPTATTDAFCITDEPIDYVAGGTGPLGRAVVQGVVPVDVNVTDAGHSYATPTASDNTKLTSAASGPARIWYKPAGTGTLRCVVKLDESGSGSSTINSGSNASNNIFTNITSDGTWTDAEVSVTLPGAGTYLLFGAATTDGLATAGTLGTAFALRMFSVTNSQTVPLNGPVVYSITISALNVQFRTTTSWQQIYTATGSDQIRIEAQRPPGMTWTHVRILHANAGSSGFFTQIGYVKLT